ncbi:cysteine desulfurase family protein [Peptoniphilus equinus]|uniref:cysteine desulfurase n=1 Tax=Peptoniphilus equinus TaxID=3016343 RepID=A0ABY7QVP5_9FIRM|nr:cysteine desulfurase family protein [Peptoniphilus equinus]WBW50325.1 cysteine desulfurase family protein [Peptoniphilus equinus]
MGIYLDNAATTALSPTVLEAMMPYLTENFFNPSSVYSGAKAAKAAITRARDTIAGHLGVKSHEIYFTSGGSEADNWALKSVLTGTRRHVLTTPIEHEAVLKTAEFLRMQGVEVDVIRVDGDGVVDVEDFKAKLRDDTALVSVMYANNELGTVEPIEAIGTILKDRDCYFHVDAVQALGSMVIDLSKLPVDMMSFSAHKIHGPKGIGALFIRDGVGINPLIHGGQQERERRAGTENVASIVGFAKAFDEARAHMEDNVKKVAAMREMMLTRLLKIPGVHFNGSVSHHLPGIINVSIEGVDSTMLLMKLDMKGVWASSGSACTSGSIYPSHVLKAIGLSDELAKNSLRISINHMNTPQQIQQASDIIIESIKELR